MSSPILLPGRFYTDNFNLNPIFCVEIEDQMGTKKNIFVRSWEDAFCINKKNSLYDISSSFIANFISGNLSSNISPFNGIKRFPKSSLVQFDSHGNYKCYKNKINKNSKLNSKGSYSEINIKFVELMRELTKDNPNIFIEHSSGLDSNIIISTLIYELNYELNKIKTITYEKNESKILINNLRKTYNLKPSNIYNFFSCFDIEDIESQIKLFGFPPQLTHNLNEIKLIKRFNYKLILSGLGGDQCLTYCGENALNDMFFNLNLRKLREFNPKNSYLIKFVLKRVFQLINPLFGRILILKKISKYWERDLLFDFLTPYGYKKLNKYRPKKQLNKYINDFDLIGVAFSKGLESEALSTRVEEETRLAKHFGIIKEYPMLNEDLLSYIRSINPELFINGSGNLRVLGKQVFKKTLPDYFFSYPDKIRYENNEFELFEELKNDLIFETGKLLDSFVEYHEYTSMLFLIEKFKEYCIKLVEKKDTSVKSLFKVNYSLRKIFILNIWFLIIDE
mgnify:CR=1 FL=1|tara:strand:+ start:1607 stop:3127 length:1521 start_codon:yes stop_codon:yes gene_type:complete